jgi:CRISPR/Cas system CMR-associated protein Cmr3 (group 5 of RAMP superfamily)
LFPNPYSPPQQKRTIKNKVFAEEININNRFGNDEAKDDEQFRKIDKIGDAVVLTKFMESKIKFLIFILVDIKQQWMKKIVGIMENSNKNFRARVNRSQQYRKEELIKHREEVNLSREGEEVSQKLNVHFFN